MITLLRYCLEMQMVLLLGRGNWNDKRNSIIAGFRAEDYDLGVAMISKPKSEAWLVAAKQNPYPTL